MSKSPRYIQCLGGPYAGCMAEDKGAPMLILSGKEALVAIGAGISEAATVPTQQIYRRERLATANGDTLELYIYSILTLQEVILDLLTTARNVSLAIGPASEKLPKGLL
jgi:hypothetical protein